MKLPAKSPNYSFDLGAKDERSCFSNKTGKLMPKLLNLLVSNECKALAVCISDLYITQNYFYKKLTP